MPGPYCSDSPAPPLHAQERGVQVADSGPHWEPLAAELNRPSRLVFRKRWTREGGQRNEVRHEAELSDAALSEQRGCGIALAALTAQHGGSHSYGLP